jgi:hypothetical protein
MLGVAGAMLQGGCDNSPPPNRVAVPTSANADQMRPQDYIKPLPPEDNRIDLRVPNQPLPENPPPGPAPSVSAGPSAPANPLQTQSPSQATQHTFADVQRDFLDAYKQVGAPHIVIFVNHTLQGQIVAPSSLEPWLAQQPAEVQPATPLRQDQYSPASENSVDYAGIENRLADWISNGGKVTVMPPSATRQKLSDSQIKDLQEGHGNPLSGLDADILIQVQVHPTQQTQRGLQGQLQVQAINVKGGAAIAHSLIDIDAPLDQSQVDGATRTVARDLMVGMIRTWTSPQPGDAGSGNAPQPPSR